MIYKKSFIILGAFILIGILGYINGERAKIDLSNKIKDIGRNGLIIKGKIINLATPLRNHDYFIYEFKLDSMTKLGKCLFQEYLTMKENFTEYRITEGANILLLVNELNPKLTIPILRKSWIQEYDLQISDSLIRYIPY